METRFLGSHSIVGDLLEPVEPLELPPAVRVASGERVELPRFR